jgi:hypothetical protein
MCLCQRDHLLRKAFLSFAADFRELVNVAVGLNHPTVFDRRAKLWAVRIGRSWLNKLRNSILGGDALKQRLA